MRVFVDTNVLVSAFTSRGLSADVFRRVLSGHELLTSEQVLEELRQALGGKMKVPPSRVNEIETYLRGFEIVPEASASPALAVRDADDAPILAAARAGGAHVLLTGDRDLLEAEPPAGLRVLSPRQFWELWGVGLNPQRT